MAPHPYTEYSETALKFVHGTDQWIPIIAMFYTFTLFLMYCHQYKTRHTLGFSIPTISLHRIGLISLFIIFIFELLMFLLSHNIYFDLPSFINSCFGYIRFIFITFIFLKYTMILCIILNLSHAIQNPFINPRYKFIGKNNRILLKHFFRAIILIEMLYFTSSIYGAWINTSIAEFKGEPNNFSYCTQILSVSSFFWLFTDDILGAIIYLILFGRNAFELCRKPIRPQTTNKYKDGNLSNVGDYDDDKHYDYNKIKYDNDDPILVCFKYQMGYSVHNNSINNIQLTPTKDKNKLRNDKEYSDLVLNIDDDSMQLNMETDTKTIKFLKQSSLIEEEEDITIDELMGIREQKRVLRLIWIIIIFYWLNILLFVVYGLFENISSLTLMISSTVIILFNDYEFGSKYWKYRHKICRIICCCDCFCGEEKIYHDNFNSTNDRDDSIPTQYKQFVRL